MARKIIPVEAHSIGEPFVETEQGADRCAEELKLESVTLDRDPAPLYKAIAAAAMAPPAQAVERKDPEIALKRLFAGRPVRRLVAGLMLVMAKRRVRDRENLRFERPAWPSMRHKNAVTRPSSLLIHQSAHPKQPAAAECRSIKKADMD